MVSGVSALPSDCSRRNKATGQILPTLLCTGGYVVHSQKRGKKESQGSQDWRFSCCWDTEAYREVWMQLFSRELSGGAFWNGNRLVARELSLARIPVNYTQAFRCGWGETGAVSVLPAVGAAGKRGGRERPGAGGCWSAFVPGPGALHGRLCSQAAKTTSRPIAAVVIGEAAKMGCIHFGA